MLSGLDPNHPQSYIVFVFGCYNVHVSSIYDFVKAQRDNYRTETVTITDGYEHRSTGRFAPSSCTTRANS